MIVYFDRILLSDTALLSPLNTRAILSIYETKRFFCFGVEGAADALTKVSSFVIPFCVTDLTLVFLAVPVDMNHQEVEKVERKRQRNRVAATKCRKRKIERITILEQEVRELNESLQSKMKEKRELEIEVEEIRNRIKIHIKQGCTGLEEYLID